MADIYIEEEGWGGILRQIARRTRNQADAEDLMHSAYLRLEAYRANKPVQDPAAFLVRTAYNLNIDNFRRDRHLSDPSNAVHVEDSAPLQDEVVEARARLDRVKQGLARLSPRTREIFLMHRLSNLKYHEIAKQLEISSSAVEKHVAKAVLFLTEWTEGW
jgi:RNA polymerase sigma-70 factor (ECF subfamily)